MKTTTHGETPCAKCSELEAKTALLEVELSALRERIEVLDEARGLIDQYLDSLKQLADSRHESQKTVWSWVKGLAAQDVQLIELITILTNPGQIPEKDIERAREIQSAFIETWKTSSSLKEIMDAAWQED